MATVLHYRLGTKVAPSDFQDEDFVTKEYVDDEIANVVVTGGGIEEPDDDGLLYARSRQGGDPTGDWVELVGGAVGTADQVLAGNTLTVSNAVGGFPVGSTISTTDSVWAIIRKLLNPRTPPVYVQPTLSLSGSNPSPGGIEIGTNIGPTLSPNFVVGDSGGVTAYRLLKNGTSIPAAAGTTAAPYDDLPAFQLTANVGYQAQADYAAGSPKPDSEGVLDPPGSGIAAGTVNSNTVTYLAQRRAFFGNLMVNAAPTTEAQIRALANNPLNARTMAVDVNGSRGVCFAYPQEWGTATSIMSSTLGNVTGAFAPTTVMVGGANNYNPIPYLVYANPSAGLASASNIYTLTV